MRNPTRAVECHLPMGNRRCAEPERAHLNDCTAIQCYVYVRAVWNHRATVKLSKEGTPTQTGGFMVYGRLTTLLSPSMITLTSLHSAFPLQSVNALWSNPSHSYALPSLLHVIDSISLSLSPPHSSLLTHLFLPHTLLLSTVVHFYHAILSYEELHL